MNNNQVLNQSNTQGTDPQNNQIQYLIVDKDVDINVILQDPSIFNQTNLNSQQSVQQQVQYSNNTLQHTSNELSSVQAQHQHVQQMPVQQVQQQQITQKSYAANNKQQFINQNTSNLNAVGRYGWE